MPFSVGYWVNIWGQWYYFPATGEIMPALRWP